MNILAIDTTTKTAAVAIQKENEIFEDSLTNEITHSEKMLPLISKNLDKNNLTLDDIDLLAIINGPGSFTGIRIGVATLKAIAHVKKLNIFSIPSTNVISYKAYRKLGSIKYFISIIDARNNRVYFNIQKIDTENNKKIIISNLLKTDNMIINDAINAISGFLDKNSISKSDVCIAGKGVNNFISLFIENGYFEKNILELYPTPKDLILLYQDINNVDDYIYNAFSLDANYERMSQAERVKKNE